MQLSGRILTVQLPRFLFKLIKSNIFFPKFILSKLDKIKAILCLRSEKELIIQIYCNQHVCEIVITM